MIYCAGLELHAPTGTQYALDQAQMCGCKTYNPWHTHTVKNQEMKANV